MDDTLTIKLKKMLLSQNFVLQDKCIQYVIHSLRDPKQFNSFSTMYLNADMIQYLCEPLLSINTTLLKSISLCLWMLSKNDKFYERNDVLYTCNSLARTLVFLLETKDPAIPDLIHLLAIIIKKGGTNLYRICNVPQVLTIIQMIFDSSKSLPGRCVTSAISILTYFLSCPSIELSNKLFNICVHISEAIFKSVTGQYTINPHVVDIASSLSSSLLRLYSTIKSRMLIDTKFYEHKEIANLLKNVAWFMIKTICLPFVLKNMNITIFYKIYKKGIKSILSPFKENLSTHTCQNIANHYAASRMIKILYELIDHKKTGMLVEELLHEMLFYLSLSYLGIDCQWPGGVDIFRCQMAWSIKNFPKTPKDICLTLMNSKNTDMKHSIIIFIYFYFLTCSNVENESLYLEPMCIYLYTVKNEIPVPVIKAVLFNISMSFVFHNAVNTVTGLHFAIQKLISLMNLQNLDLVFTHHPALLRFLFALSIIPDKIQSEFIKHWIQNLDDDSSIALEKFCLKNNKAKLCLLNVLVNYTNIDDHKQLMGFNIVKRIITTEKNCEHKTLSIIWEMLPMLLGSFCCDENSNAIGSTNLMHLLNLTESFPLDSINVFINEHRDTVYTLSSIIKTYEFTCTKQYLLLSALLQHLLTLIQSPKSDVFNIIKKHQKFLSVLQKLCLSENNNVCFLTFKTVIQLCHLEKKFEMKSKNKILNLIALKNEHILNAMTRLCQNCIISSIKLFQIVMNYYEEAAINNTIDEFNEVPTAECFKSIFMQLVTLIAQGLDFVSEHAWECITTILSAKFVKHLENSSELQLELAYNPWLNFVLAIIKSFSKKYLEFLHFWFYHFILNNEDKFTLYGVKALCPRYTFNETMLQISTVIMNQIYEKHELLTKAKNIIHLILKKKFLISNELEGKMNKFLNTSTN